VRIRKVFVEKLAPAVSGPAVDGGGAVAGSGDSDLRSRYPKYDVFLAVRDWLDTPDARERLHRAGVRPLIQG
jgi:hypothetical protein